MSLVDTISVAQWFLVNDDFCVVVRCPTCQSVSYGFKPWSGETKDLVVELISMASLLGRGTPGYRHYLPCLLSHIIAVLVLHK